jgi:hypothetical protein
MKKKTERMVVESKSDTQTIIELKKQSLMETLLVVIAAFVLVACSTGNKGVPAQESNQAADTAQMIEVDPVIESIFYNLPLGKKRLDLREVLVNDKRFILTDTTFNNFPPPSFFKGITEDKGLIKSNPDSIQLMLIYGNAALITEKGGQADTTKHPMILECMYYFSDIDSAKMEYERISNLLYPIYTDTSTIMDDKWEAPYSKGTQKCIGKIFDHFDPYYRVAISYISYIPDDVSKPVFVLDIAFGKEDIRN